MADRDLIEALEEASFDGRIDEVQRLIGLGADPNALGRNWNALHAAIENMHSHIVRYLIEKGADVETTCHNFRPLHHAIDIESDAATQAGDPGPPDPILTEILLRSGAEPNSLAPDGRTPLALARSYNHVRAVELLVTWGARE
jgi:ankyrin repeat protein